MRFPMPITSLPGANLLPPEHKIGIFVRFWGLEALFSGFSSTKSRFLCAFGVQNPRFQAFRAQNRGFCALLGFGSPDFKRFEHKIGVFVRFQASGPSFSGISLLLEEHFRVMEQFDSTFVVAHVLRIYDTAYCLKLHYGSGDIEGCSEYFYLNLSANSVKEEVYA